MHQELNELANVQQSRLNTNKLLKLEVDVVDMINATLKVKRRTWRRTKLQFGSTHTSYTVF